MTRSTRLRDAALDAVASGLSVFPCAPRGKVPVLPGWEQAATRDPDQITQWWAEGPAYNIGIACGPSSLVVIDLDSGKGQTAPPEFAGATDGWDVLAMLAQRAGQPAPFHTWTVATPTSGHHLYYRVPEGSAPANSVNALGWKIISSRCGFWLVSVLFGCEPREARGPRRVRRVVP